MTEPILDLSGSPARPAQPQPPPGRHFEPIATRPDSRQIIRALEKVRTLSDLRPERVFSDWLFWLEAVLDTLPAHLRSAAQMGHPRTPEAQALYAQLQARYRPAGYVDRTDQVWDGFTTAFGVLVKSVRPGLWAYSSYSDTGYMGPDVLGDTYLAYSRYDPHWSAYDLIPWADHLSLVQAIRFNGEAEVLRRIKAACHHPDNIAGQTALQNHPNVDRPEQVVDWLFNRIIPAAMPYYEPFSLADAWAGTGARLLAMALHCPDWAVLRGLVTFVAVEPVEMCLKMCRINEMLYGLNGYYLRLLDAAGNDPFLIESTNQPQALLLQAAVNVYTGRPPVLPDTGRTFEQLFRRKQKA